MHRILFITVALLSLAGVCPALEITFLANSAVEDSVIRLGDIVRFSDDSATAQALASQIAGQAPAPGETVYLRSVHIKQYLLSTVQVPGDVVWQGSPTVTVVRRGITVSADRILEIIAEFIDNNKANLPEAKVRFVPSVLPLPFTVPMGTLTYDVIPSNPAIVGSSRVSIIFRVDGRVAKNMSVRGEMEALGEIVVASQPLRKDTILRPQQLTKKAMDISNISNAGYHLEDFVGKRLTRSLRSGSPVLSSMVESLPVVRRGEKVRIVIDSGQLHVTASGLAYNDGKMGEMIRVQNISSNKIIYCRVAAPGLVEVLL
jgi:flagella basal body P-ring formation protein FlgA